jgi:antitoxin VapB
MVLHIRKAETDRLARELAQRMNTTVTEAVTIAIRDKLATQAPHPDSLEARIARIRAAQQRLAEGPVLDPRSADDILGYDENGLPT